MKKGISLLIAVIMSTIQAVEAQNPIVRPIRQKKEQTTVKNKPIGGKSNSGSSIHTLTPDELFLKGMDAYDAADYVKALKYFRDAANQGNGWAQYYLGRMFYEGYGVSKDFQEAMKWFEKAAKQEDADAQLYIGIMYEEGKGLDKNNNEAAKWYRKAAEHGYAPAQYNLGMLYLSDKPQEAFKWFQKAAEQGHAAAQNNLGVMYEKGIGVKKDSEKAEEWFQKADAQERMYGVKMLSRIKK